MNKKLSFLATYWRSILFYSLSIIALLALLSYKLGSLTPGLSEVEKNNLQNTINAQSILNNPLYLPYKVGELLVFTFTSNSIFLVRTVSVFFGFVTIILFYLLIRKWFSARIAYISALLLATSSWFLHYARLATPDILLPLAVVVLLGLGWWIYKTKRINSAAIIAVIVVSIILYIPGMIWLIVVGACTQIKHIKQIIRDISISALLVCVGLSVLLLVPLARAIAFDFTVFERFIGWPITMNIITLTKNILYVPISLFIRTEPLAIYNLGRLPLLDIFSTTMFVLGAYSYIMKLSLVRTKVLITFGVITSLLIALTSQASIIIAPIVYAIIAGGINLMFEQWYTVFPSNPIAKSIGTALLYVAITITCFYQLNRYFIAWPHSPITRTNFTHHMPNNLLQ